MAYALNYENMAKVKVVLFFSKLLGKLLASKKERKLIPI